MNIVTPDIRVFFQVSLTLRFCDFSVLGLLASFICLPNIEIESETNWSRAA